MKSFKTNCWAETGGASTIGLLKDGFSGLDADCDGDLDAPTFSPSGAAESYISSIDGDVVCCPTLASR